jgi:hypothetical protein
MVPFPFWSFVLALLQFISLMCAQHNGGKVLTARTSKNSREDLLCAS